MLSSLLDKLATLESCNADATSEQSEASDENIRTETVARGSPETDHSAIRYASYWASSTETLNSMLVAAKEELTALEGSNVERQSRHCKDKLMDLRGQLSSLLDRCGVETNSIVRFTETPVPASDEHPLADEPHIVVWAQCSDDPSKLRDRTARLRIMREMTQIKQRISYLRASTLSLNVLQRREKRLSNDLDSARVTWEYIQDVQERLEHTKRMVNRSAIDEDAILQLNRTTVFEEEKQKRHLAGNDIRGLKAIRSGYQMKAVEKAAELPENEALSALVTKANAVRRSLFADLGLCCEAWKRIDTGCTEVLELTKQTVSTRADRRALAERAFATLRDSLAEAAVASIK